jgi:hypothetical protein
VIDGSGEGAVSGDGRAGDFAKREKDEMSIPDFPQQKELDEYVGGNPDLIEIYRKAGYSRTIEKQSKELGEEIYSFAKFPTHEKVFLKNLDKLEKLYKVEWNPLTDHMKREVVEKIATLKEYFIKGLGIDNIEEAAEELKDTLDHTFTSLSLEEDFGNKKQELDSVVYAILEFKIWNAKERAKALEKSARSPDSVLEELLKSAKLYSQSPWMHCSVLTIALLCGIVEAYAHPLKVHQDNILYLQKKLFIPSIIACAIAYFYPGWVYLAYFVLSGYLYMAFRDWQLKKKTQQLNDLRSEIQSEGYDGEEIAKRLHKLEDKGITFPSIVYPLLRLKHKPSKI